MDRGIANALEKLPASRNVWQNAASGTMHQSAGTCALF
jgi:hypothetical protein